MTSDSRSRVPLRSKLPATGTTIFSVMSALAAQHGAVNLGQGFPDYAIDPTLIDLVAAAMRAGHNQYPLMPGVMKLREAIAVKVFRLYGHAYDPEHEITVTTGATQAIYTAIQALAHAGDEVIVFEPAYDSYIPSVRLAGATPIPIALSVPDYRIDWTTVERAITPRTRVILINTPNNPGTSVLTAADRNALAKLVRGTPIVVVSDEVYEHMVFDGARHESIAGHAELALRSVVIGSCGKRFTRPDGKSGMRSRRGTLPTRYDASTSSLSSPSTARFNMRSRNFSSGPSATNRYPHSLPQSAIFCVRFSRERRSRCFRAPAATSSSHATIGSATTRHATLPSVWCATSASRRFRCRLSIRTAPIIA